MLQFVHIRKCNIATERNADRNTVDKMNPYKNIDNICMIISIQDIQYTLIC